MTTPIVFLSLDGTTMITNPHAVLFVVEKPSELSSEQEKRWPSFLAEINALRGRIEGIERPNESLLLIPLKNGLPVLSRLSFEAERHGFGYRSVITFQENDTVTPLAAPEAEIRVGDLLPPATTHGEEKIVGQE